MIFGSVLAVLLYGVVLAKGLQDPDYFWHVTVGQLIVEDGIPRTDPFSFTWGGMPWTTHEWLSEALMYGLVSGLGRIPALMVFAVFAGGIFFLSAIALASRKVATGAIAIASSLGALVLVPYVTLRPQIISWLFTAALIWLLLSLRPNRPGTLIALPLLFVAWANLHGLWVVGLGFIAMYTIFTVIGLTPMSGHWRLVVLAAFGSLLASMLTPAGPEGILYPLRYIEAGDWGLANIEEWQSPNFHEPAHLALLVMIVALAANGGRGAPGWLAAVSYVTMAMALLALRNAPVAAVTGTFVLAMGIDVRWRAWRAMQSASQRHISPRRALQRRFIEIAIGLVVAVAGLVILVPRDLASGVDSNIERRFPTAAIEVLKREKPDVRLLAEYGWGGYAISELYSLGGRVFVDGRNDMYDQGILEDYSSIRSAEDGWERLVGQYGVEAMLFPPDAPIVRGFAEDAGWCEALANETQVLLFRDC